MNFSQLTNFWIELKETQSGHQILNTTIEGQHWKGFLEERTGQRENGEIYTYKSANMRPCVWDKCKICHPDLEIF